MMGKQADEFKALLDLVAKDARGRATEEESAMLRQPDKLGIWEAALSAIKSDIDAQLSSRRSDLDEKRQMLDDRVESGHLTRDRARSTMREFRAEQGKQRTKILWFKRSIEQKIAECKVLKAQAEGGIDV